MGGGGRRSTNVIETAIQLISAAVVPPPWIINRRHHPSSDTLRTNNESSSSAMSSKATPFFNRLDAVLESGMEHTVGKMEIFVQKSGSGYSKIFQLTVWTSKLYFRDLKLKIDEEYLMYRS